MPRAFSGIEPLAPDNAGVVSLYSSTFQKPTIYTFTFASPLTYTTKAEIWLGPSPAYTINGNAVDVTGSPQWADITVQGGNSISTFEIQISTNNSADFYPVFGSFKLDGVYYTTGGTTLTLTDDTDLDLFEVGDTAFVPGLESSKITQYVTRNYSCSAATDSSQSDGAHSGSTADIFSGNYENSYYGRASKVTWSNFNGMVPATETITIKARGKNQSIGMQLIVTTDEGSASHTYTGAELTNGAFNWVTTTFNLTGTITEIRMQGGSSGDECGVGQITIDGITCTNGATELTFEDDTNLSTFTSGTTVTDSITGATANVNGTPVNVRVPINSINGTFQVDSTVIGPSVKSGLVVSVDSSSNELVLSEINGTWLVGDQVNTNQKSITGTVSSVDATGRTVTLDAISGGWSANTGNYLIGKELAFTDDERFTLQSFNAAIKSKNNSTEPITYAIKGSVGAKLLANPVSSVITEATTNTLQIDYTAGVSAGMINPQNLFDGNPSTGTSTPNNVTYDFWSSANTGLQIPCKGGDVITGMFNAQSMNSLFNPVFTLADGSTSGGPLLDNSDKLVRVAPDNAVGITSLYYKYVDGGSVVQPWTMYGLKINNELVTEEYIQQSLIFTDDTNLSNFPVGTTVSQIGVNTPVSSAIINVSDNLSLSTVGCNKTGGSDHYQDGTATIISTGSTYTINTGIRYIFSETQIDTSVNTLTLGRDSGNDFYLVMSENAAGGNKVQTQATNTPAASTISGQSCVTFDKAFFDWTESNYGTRKPFVSVYATGNGDMVFEVVQAVVGVSLTLTDDTNLANFRVGDSWERRATSNYYWHK